MAKCFWTILMGSLVRLPLFGATLRVPADVATIQAALDGASSGDTVLVASGEYLIHAPLQSNRLQGGVGRRALSLRSEEGAERTWIRLSPAGQASPQACVMLFERPEDSEFVIEGFTLAGGRGLP